MRDAADGAIELDAFESFAWASPFCHSVRASQTPRAAPPIVLAHGVTFPVAVQSASAQGFSSPAIQRFSNWKP